MKPNILAEIIAHKKQEVQTLKDILKNQPAHLMNQMRNGSQIIKPMKNFSTCLIAQQLSVIAEVKRASPSRGKLAEISDPAQLAIQYANHAASAISVLTDEKFFKGSNKDLTHVVESLKIYPTPILRKDFIVDKIQIIESIAMGADAILLIVACLGKETKKFLDEANAYGIDALVEVKNREELEIAIEAEAKIIGINNRDLQTFEINLNRSFQLIDQIPKSIIKISESGILDSTIAHNLHSAGFDGVLIGEALVKAENPGVFIEACRYEN